MEISKCGVNTLPDPALSFSDWGSLNRTHVCSVLFLEPSFPSAGARQKAFHLSAPFCIFFAACFLGPYVGWWAFSIVILWFYNLFIMHYCASKQYECLCKWGHFINKWSYLLLLIKEAAHNAPGALVCLHKFVNWTADLTRLTTAASSRISLFMPINALRGFSSRSWGEEQKGWPYKTAPRCRKKSGILEKLMVTGCNDLWPNLTVPWTRGDTPRTSTRFGQFGHLPKGLGYIRKCSRRVRWWLLW